MLNELLLLFLKPYLQNTSKKIQIITYKSFIDFIKKPYIYKTFLQNILLVDEYPSFGMLVPNRHASSDSYRYGFQGQEKDDEIKGEGNSYDFGARMYDSRIGRWFAPDPLEKEFPFVSTYVYALNNPLYFIDEDGKAPDPVFLKYIQQAINNVPKLSAVISYNDYARKAYLYNDKEVCVRCLSESKYLTKLPLNKKYIREYKRGQILNDYGSGGKAKMNFYGVDMEISYSYIQRKNINGFTIYGSDFKLGKDGKPHVYGGKGAAGGISSSKGFFMELDNNTSDSGVPSVILQFQSYENGKEAELGYKSVYEETFNAFLDKDPLVKMYYNLEKEYVKLTSLQNDSTNDPKNKKKKDAYKIAERKYLKNREKFVEFQDKAIKYEKEQKK